MASALMNYFIIGVLCILNVSKHLPAMLQYQLVLLHEQRVVGVGLAVPHADVSFQ